jgi:hypothetical protein
MSLLVELEPVLIELFFEFPVVSDAAARESANFSHMSSSSSFSCMSAVPVVAGVLCLDTAHLYMTALVR